MVDRRLARNAEGGAGRASIQDGDRQRGDASEASRGRCCERIGGPPQNFKEYDPEWARAFTAGTAMSGCDHVRMLESVRVPVLFTHHFRQLEAGTGASWERSPMFRFNGCVILSPPLARRSTISRFQRWRTKCTSRIPNSLLA